VAREVKMSKEVKDAKIESTETNMSTKENVIKSQPQTVSSAEKIGVISEDASNENNGDSENSTSSFADVLYDEIVKVIGGNNPNQFFSMSLPGTLLDASSYSYDTSSGSAKPAHVKANESELANRLYDAAFISAGANGKHLTTQYRTALNMLTPKLNGKLFEAKTQLREVLMTPYPYNFEDGKDDVLTLEQVFYRLYGEYVAAKEAWSQKQIDKKNELKKKYPDNTSESNAQINDEYLEWYGIVAESEELIVEEKYGKVLNVFSPGDMEIITGILESGSGRELSEARTTLENVGEKNPNGGTVYPVTFYPQNWFSLLDTSFTPVDLLESPAALTQQLQVLEAQKSNITANLNQFLQILPDKNVVDGLKSTYDESEKAYKDSFKDYLSGNTSATLDTFKSLVEVYNSNNSKVNNSTIQRTCGVSSADADKILDILKTDAADCIQKQQNLVDASDKAVSSAMEYFSKNNMLQMQSMLQPLQQQLDEINEKISELKQQIAMSTIMQQDPVADSNGNMEKPDSNLVAPNKVPDGFTQMILTSSISSVNNQSSKSANASQSSYGVSFFFGGYSCNSSHQDAVENEIKNNSSMEIQIGMSVAKVEIDREWFNPGVFMLTDDMYNTSSERIAPTDDTSFFDPDREKVNRKMDQMNRSVFSCYPVGFVIAKDVTIKFASQKAVSSSFAESVEDHSSKGGGFFIFGGSSSSSSSSSQSASTATSSANSVTVKFTAPQILGYYLEAVSPDNSTNISDTSNKNSDYISIFEFISTFQKMLDEHNSKYNKELMKE
jgi:hypothetical protein